VSVNSAWPAASWSAARAGRTWSAFSVGSVAAVSFGCTSAGVHRTCQSPSVRTSGRLASYFHGVPRPGSAQLAEYAALAWSSSCFATAPRVAVTRAPSPSAFCTWPIAVVAAAALSVWPLAPAMSLFDQLSRKAFAVSSGPGLPLLRKQPEVSSPTMAMSAASVDGRRRKGPPRVRAVGTQNRTLENVPTLPRPTRSYARRAGTL
jgi:hypothetical protein